MPRQRPDEAERAKLTGRERTARKRRRRAVRLSEWLGLTLQLLGKFDHESTSKVVWPGRDD
jgi:hypothetical protein